MFDVSAVPVMPWSTSVPASSVSRAFEIVGPRAQRRRLDALGVQHGAHQAGVVRLGRQDAGRGLEVGLVGDQRCRALVRGDAHVLENERAEQESLVARVRVEGLARLDEPGRTRGR